MSKRILLVGHCGVDGPRLQDELIEALPAVEVERINSDADLEQACEDGAALLLVNREPVGFDQEGLDLIKRVKSDYPGCTVMLVSDYEDAQTSARKLGAIAGFGKSEMGTGRLPQLVNEALA